VEFSNEVTGVGLAIIDGQVRYVEVNRRLAALNGIPKDAHANRSICDVVPEIGPLLTQLVDRVLQIKLPLRDVKFSARVPFVKGPLRDWLASFFPVNLGGGAMGVAHTVIEIIDRSRVEEALAQLALGITEPLHSEPLTSREADVLNLIGQGKTTKEIAALLSISAQTVGNHRKQICRKLNLHSTAEIAAHAAKRSVSFGGCPSGHLTLRVTSP
jgi:DNA-binding CsgD family transcriptional regulator